MRAAAVVGNLKAPSRTSRLAVSVAESILRFAGEPVDPEAISVIELSSLASSLFTWGDAQVAEAKSRVLDCDVLVVASPVYKASVTGLLKAFIDQFGHDELAALPTVPVMIGGSPLHYLAVESQLRPVLIEVGASCPTRGVYVLEQDIEQVDEQVSAWLSIWGNVLVGGISARREAATSLPQDRQAT